MEIFRVDYCKGNGDIMSSALFDNFDSAKKHFDEFVRDYEASNLGKGNHVELFRLTSFKDGYFGGVEWLNGHWFNK